MHLHAFYTSMDYIINDGNFYIANEASGSAAGSLSVIESRTNRVLAAIPIPGYFLRAVAVANEKVYVTGANNVFVVKVV
jgi:DNA-binding beta-propeller fold protein YncE